MLSSTIDSLTRGLIAGLTATLALSLLILIKQAVGLIPDVDLVMILAHALGYHSPAAGWAAQCIIGVLLWGPVFAWVEATLPFSHWVNGLLFSSVVWWGVMLIVMPEVGAGLFGLQLGIATPTVTLILHWAYGAVLGMVYGALRLGRSTRGSWMNWPPIRLPHRAHHA
jgi:hypothetical protein